MSSSVINLDEEEMKEFLEDDVQTKSYAHTDVITDVKTQKKPSDNANLRNIGIIEEDQTHLKPSIVDTSLVKGQITQVCCKNFNYAF